MMVEKTSYLIFPKDIFLIELLIASYIALAAPTGTPKRALLPPCDDSSRHRVPPWFREASNKFVKEWSGQPPCLDTARPGNNLQKEPGRCTHGRMAPSGDQQATDGGYRR